MSLLPSLLVGCYLFDHGCVLRVRWRCSCCLFLVFVVIVVVVIFVGGGVVVVASLLVGCCWIFDGVGYRLR